MMRLYYAPLEGITGYAYRNAHRALFVKPDRYYTPFITANQKYTTDGMSEAVFRTICEENQIPYQVFTNRSDMLGGSTLGNIANTQVSLNTVDIGLAQLAMHSSCETAGTQDLDYLVRFAREFC